MPIVKVCFSPMLYPLYAAKETVTVVVDILRATSAICTAFEHGIEKVIPVPDVEDTYFYKDHEDVILAAERGGEIVEGFRYGNSPLTYMNGEIKGKTLVITTTNGTQAIEAAKDSEIIMVGSFLNFSALTSALREIDRDVMVLCAGWKNRFNLEDTLFAGAVTENLLDSGFSYANDSDAALASLSLFQAARADLYGFLQNSSHRNRLEKLNLEEDVRYCLQFDKTSCVPFLQEHALIDSARNGGVSFLKNALKENHSRG
jgi:2-phosphosulfolactate phosphatase